MHTASDFVVLPGETIDSAADRLLARLAHGLEDSPPAVDSGPTDTLRPGVLEDASHDPADQLRRAATRILSLPTRKI
jgi:hypothetical protein